MRHIIDPPHSRSVPPVHSIGLLLCRIYASLFSPPVVASLSSFAVSPTRVSRSFRGHFGVGLGSFRGRLGVVLGSV